MKITIIMATYNAERTVEQAIKSVVMQTHPAIEFLIIDGQSTDTTLSIARKYENRIREIISEPDHGIYEALNKGVRMATGDYIYVLGADDCLVDPKVMERVSEIMDKNPDVDVLCGRVWLVDERYKIQCLFDNNLGCSVREDWDSRNIKAPHQGFFIKSGLMKRLQFDERFSVGADYKLLIQLWQMTDINIVKIPEAIAFYANSGTSSRTMKKRAEEYKFFLEEMGLDGQGFDAQMDSYLGFVGMVKKLVRVLMELCLVRRMYLIHKGWERHKCENSFCRWCNHLGEDNQN